MESNKNLQDVAKDLEKAINSLGSYAIEIGVFSPETGRKEKVKVGITNAELMFIHENGSPLHHIPSRPVLQLTINYANRELLSKTIDKAIKAYFDSNFERKAFEDELNKLCMRMEKTARKIIYSNEGILAPNAPSTIKAKGDNHPLFDTGQLARSITCKLVRL